jgi:sugar/nucleoside kinase (ribokinase family)
MKRSATAKLSERFDICIAGDTSLDLILDGLPEELPSGVRLLGSGFRTVLGGASAILAHNLSALGARVAFISQVGDDEMGRIALDQLSRSGLDLSHLPARPGFNTGVNLQLPNPRRNHTFTYPGVMSEMTIADIDLAWLGASSHFHLSSLFLQPALHSGLPALFDYLRLKQICISLDPGDDPSGSWGGVIETLLDKIDLFLPSEDAVLHITGKSTVEQALDALAPRIPLIVVKCGSRGALVQHGRQRGWVASLPERAVDTIGAGDSFNAGFLSFYLKSEDPLRAAAMGNVAEALSTLRSGGTAAFRDAELRDAFLKQHKVA